MKSAGPIRSYVRELRRRLWIRGLADRDSLAEIEAHLLEAEEAGLDKGLSGQEAELRALERFGAVKTIVASFEKERTDQMQKLLLAVGVAAGLLIAYVDTRPHWDDSGITVGLLLVSAGLLTLLGYRRPWLMALAVGIWLPAYYIYQSQAWSMLVLLLIPLVGAYAGWAVNLGVRKVFRPA